MPLNSSIFFFYFVTASIAKTVHGKTPKISPKTFPYTKEEKALLSALPPGTNVLLEAASHRIHRSGGGIAHTTIAGVVGELGPLDSVSWVIDNFLSDMI
jgi:hypothetical protein